MRRVPVWEAPDHGRLGLLPLRKQEIGRPLVEPYVLVWGGETGSGLRSTGQLRHHPKTTFRCLNAPKPGVGAGRVTVVLLLSPIKIRP